MVYFHYINNIHQVHVWREDEMDSSEFLPEEDEDK